MDTEEGEVQTSLARGGGDLLMVGEPADVQNVLFWNLYTICTAACGALASQRLRLLRQRTDAEGE